MRVLFGILKYLFIVLVVSSIIASIFGAGFFIYFSKGLPNIITTEDYKPLVATQVLGKGDAVVGEFFEQRRYVVPFEKIPDFVIRSFVAAEDDRFFEHHGIDLQGIIRAAIANFRAGRLAQGGSTITQQVAKSLLLTPEKSFLRKIREVILANRMERNLNKKQILFLYLNQIYLGQGAYGVAAASKVYFNKEVKDLNLAEAAVLAGLPQAPSAYNPVSNPKRAKERQTYVLRRLFEDGTITESQMNEAVKQPIKIFLPQEINEKTAPYYVEHVRKYLLERYGKEAVYESGLKINTPIDPILSLHATKVVQEGLRVIDKRQGYRGPIRRIKTSQELATAIQEVQDYNITRKYPFKILLPEGTFARDAKVRLANSGTVGSDIFSENEIYQAIVIHVDDSQKEVHVSLGLLNGIISLEKMKWAVPTKTPSSVSLGTISKPSQTLSKGEVIWVRYLGKTRGGLAQLALEQIPVLQGALLSVDAITGNVSAMVGGFDFHTSEFNRAVQAERQPGSAFKPVIYAAAVDKGYTPATIIQDSPIVFGSSDETKWKPENYEEKFYGDTLFRAALIHSRNVPTIKIVQDIQIPYLIEYAKRLGINRNFNPDLSIALGSTTLTLLELTQVFSIFARGGRLVKPIFIQKILDRDGNVLEENLPTAPKPQVERALASPPKPVAVAGELQANAVQGKDLRLGVWDPDPTDPFRVMDTRTAYVMTHLMNEVTTQGTALKAKDLGRPAAGKTGTTSDYQDAWFLGYVPQLVTGVWVGFDAQKTIGQKAAAAAVALPIWIEYMKEAVKQYPVENFSVPKGVAFSVIDSRTGKLSASNRSYAVREAFIAGTEPSASFEHGETSDTENPAAAGSTSGVSSEDFFKEDIQ